MLRSLFSCCFGNFHDVGYLYLISCNRHGHNCIKFGRTKDYKTRFASYKRDYANLVIHKLIRLDDHKKAEGLVLRNAKKKHKTVNGSREWFHMEDGDAKKIMEDSMSELRRLGYSISVI